MRSAAETTASAAKTGSVFRYRISGLIVASDFELPGAAPAPAEAPDVAVRLGRVPSALRSAVDAGPTWALGEEAFLLRVPGVARFLVERGRRIAVELEPGARLRAAAPFVLGAAFGVLLHQRGAAVLHGAAVAEDGAAMVICGESGAGKSTLAAALCREGLTFVADDLCLVGLDAERRPLVAPDGRQLKLWRDAIEQLAVGERRGDPVVEDVAKYFVEPEVAVAAPPRLTAIYILREAKPPLQEGIEPLSLPDAMRMLDIQAYRPRLRERLTAASAKLAQGAAIMGHARVFTLTRPRGFEHLPGTVAALSAHWRGLAR